MYGVLGSIVGACLQLGNTKVIHKVEIHSSLSDHNADPAVFARSTCPSAAALRCKACAIATSPSEYDGAGIVTVLPLIARYVNMGVPTLLSAVAST